jgi:hypothetical protein
MTFHPGSPETAELLREQFARRAAGLVQQIAESASPEALETALSAKTGYGMLVSALANAPVGADVFALDPFADAIARGLAAREPLAKAAGGLLNSDETASLLETTPDEIEERRSGHRLLAVRAGSGWRYPAIQFDAHGEVPPLWSQVLAGCAAAGMSGWSTLGYMLAPSTVLNGFTPLEALRRQGPEARDVLRQLAAAQVDAYG